MIKIYVSSFVFSNTKEGAYSTIKKEGLETEIVVGEKINTTKDRMDLKGIIKGLSLIEDTTQEIEIISDNKEIIKVIERLKKLDIIQIKNFDLWAKYLNLAENLKIKTRLIKNMNETTETRECFANALNHAMTIKDKRLCQTNQV